jgi:hypothetical protein
VSRQNRNSWSEEFRAAFRATLDLFPDNPYACYIVAGFLVFEAVGSVIMLYRLWDLIDIWGNAGVGALLIAFLPVFYLIMLLARMIWNL